MKNFLRLLIIITTICCITLSLVGCKNIARNIPTKEKFDASLFEETFFDDFDTLDSTRWRVFTGNGYKSKPTHIH